MYKNGEYDLEKNKFLVPHDLTSGQLVYIVRSRIKLRPEIALFFFINNNYMHTGEDMKTLWDKHRDPDGFLYVIASLENTFG